MEKTLQKRVYRYNNSGLQLNVPLLHFQHLLNWNRLYGKENLDIINNASVPDSTFKYLTETKIFDALLFWCSPNARAFTLMLSLQFMFLLLKKMLAAIVLSYWWSLLLMNSTSLSHLNSTLKIQLALHPRNPFFMNNLSIWLLIVSKNTVLQCWM